MNLEIWTEIYLKFRDMNKKQIQEITKIEKGFLVKTKTGEVYLVIVEDNLSLNNITNKDVKIVVCQNTKENVRFLVNSWDKFLSRKDLLIVFANPKTNKKWLLNPFLHAKIADSSSLEQGLLSIANNT